MPEELVSDADHLSLARLMVEIAWRIDHGQADRVWELFVADGVLDTTGRSLVKITGDGSMQQSHIAGGRRIHVLPRRSVMLSRARPGGAGTSARRGGAAASCGRSAAGGR